VSCKRLRAVRTPDLARTAPPDRYCSPVTLRAAEGSDVAAIAEVYLSALNGMTYLPRLYSDEQARAFVSDVLIPTNEVWVAEESGRVVGFAGLADGFLSHLWVRPADQNQGVGTALLKLAMARSSGGLQLWVFQKNADARRFYERNGFRLAELTDGEQNQVHEPDARYVWEPAADS
jgi:ribosomal protein S18 acetylase RimI-like enzyme